MSFKKKIIEVRIELDSKYFVSNPESNVLTLTGLRMRADIKKVGQFGQGVRAQINIYGLALSDINDLSVVTFGALSYHRNRISIMAGEEGDAALTEVFYGDITDAWFRAQGAPESFIEIKAVPSFIQRVADAPPLSFPVGCEVKVAMKSLADAMGLAFVDHGVTEVLSPSYYPNTLLMQARAIAEHSNIIMYTDGRTLHIAPYGGAFDPDLQEIPLLNKDSGLVGYPEWNQQGIMFRSQFNPSIRFQSRVRLEQDLPIANGEWVILSVDYQLDCEMPDGNWFCNVVAGRLGIGTGQ